MRQRKPKRKIQYMGSSFNMKKKKATYSAPVTRPVTTISSRTGLGNRKTVKMIYSEKFNLGGALLGAANVYQFRLNSIFDPNFTGGGHQPTTHDQLAVLFEEYTVTDVRYRISLINTSTTVAGLAAIQTSDNFNTFTDITTLIEQGQCEWKNLGVLNGSNMIVTFNGQVDLARVMGESRSKYADGANYTATFGNSPTDIAYLNVYLSEASTGTAPTCICLIEMEMNVICKGSAAVPQS